MEDLKNQTNQAAVQEHRVEKHQPSMDTIFETLSNNRRREIVNCLRNHEESVETSTLVDEVAAAENDTDVQSLAYEQRKRVYTTLHQSHLPKLVEDGFIERDGDEVKLTETAERLEAHIELEVAQKRDSSRRRFGIWNSIRSRLPF